MEAKNYPTAVNEKKFLKRKTKIKSLVAFLFVVLLIGVPAMFLVTCKVADAAKNGPDYREVVVGVQSLIESQTSFYIYKSDSEFADNMEALGFTKSGGEVRLQRVWNADYNSDPEIRQDLEGYYFMTFPVAGTQKQQVVIFAVPARGRLPFFTALYGGDGVSMLNAHSTDVYWCVDAAFLEMILSQKENISIETIKQIINKSKTFK